MCANEWPGVRTADLNEPSSETIWWFLVSLFFQTMRSPFWIVSLSGTNPDAVNLDPPADDHQANIGVRNSYSVVYLLQVVSWPVPLDQNPPSGGLTRS